jgi:hypothetical protein
MRAVALVMVLLALPGVAWAQPRTFEDVPPWHWAFDAVQRVAAARIMIGYPRNDRDLAANAAVQVYEAFANSAHEAAREWAERFLTNLPADWPRPLERSPLRGYRLEQLRVTLFADRGTVSFTAVVRLADDRALRATVRVAVTKDNEGRWRVNYPDLAAGQPQIFR